MSWCLLDKFFDNTSVAGIITVSTGGIIGVWTFWKQRRQTKIENLSENIELLVYKCEQVNFILDRISSTYLSLIKSKEQKYKEIFIESSKKELSDISLIINDEIPKIRAKIKNYTGFYFSKNEKVVKNMINFFDELKKWHTNVSDMAFVSYEFEKRIRDNEKFNLKGIQDSAKRFVDSLK